MVRNYKSIWLQWDHSLYTHYLRKVINVIPQLLWLEESKEVMPVHTIMLVLSSIQN